MSIPFRVRDAVAWTQGRLLQGSPDASLAGVSIDTRSLAPGQLFIAIAGPRHDAHDYLAQAAAAGAAALLVARGRGARSELPPALPLVEVEDTTRALGSLAAGHRRGFDGPLVAITGSNGKTTTKEMCAAILAVGAPTLKTLGNLNNQFGLPLTLLSREREHRRVVVELGMNHRGEIAELARIAQPDIGVVTNIGHAHVEYLGSREEIAREKGDLLAALPAQGTAVVNAEDAFAGELASRSPARVVRFGRTPDADVRAERIAPPDASGIAFELVAPAGRRPLRVAGLGDTAVLNALAASAAALAAGATLDEVREGLARYRPVAGRLERRGLPGGAVLIDDSYNANPQSMEVALRLLARAGTGARRIAVIGDMGELGPAAEKAHLEAGRLAAALGIEFVVAVGAQSERVAAGALAGGMDPSHVRTARDSGEAGEPVHELLVPGAWVLVKGSRAAKMERVSEYLEAEARPS